jgi:hypothetical protein
MCVCVCMCVCMCVMCTCVSASSIVEDEYHHIRVCPLYSELGLKYIKSYYVGRPSITLTIKYKSDNYVQSRKVLAESNTAQGQLHNLVFVYLCVCIYVVVCDFSKFIIIHILYILTCTAIFVSAIIL